MRSKSQMLAGARKIMAKMDADTEAYDVNVCGIKITVLPHVFSPKYFTDSEYFASKVPKLVGKRSFLEIGTGTGIVALAVALKGARRVVTTDVSPFAVKNAKANFKRHRLHVPVRPGETFKPLKRGEKFDVIFWNHPFHFSPKKPEYMLQRSGFDYHYAGLKDFFKNAKNHLTKDGEVLLGTGSIARINDIKRIARENGYTYELLTKDTVRFAHRGKTRIDLRVYSFRPALDKKGGLT